MNETQEDVKPEVLQELKRLELKLGEARASADCMDAEIDDAIERFTSVKERVNRLIAENSKSAKALDAALNDVAIWKRAAFWFGLAALVFAFVAAT